MLFLIAAIVSFSANIASSIFLVWNTFLVSTNQSTIEFYGNVFGANAGINPYQLSYISNIYSIFGPSILYTVFVPNLEPPPGDGIIYPLNKKYQAPPHLMIV